MVVQVRSSSPNSLSLFLCPRSTLAFVAEQVAAPCKVFGDIHGQVWLLTWSVLQLRISSPCCSLSHSPSSSSPSRSSDSFGTCCCSSGEPAEAMWQPVGRRACMGVHGGNGGGACMGGHGGPIQTAPHAPSLPPLPFRPHSPHLQPPFSSHVSLPAPSLSRSVGSSLRRD